MTAMSVVNYTSQKLAYHCLDFTQFHLKIIDTLNISPSTRLYISALLPQHNVSRQIVRSVLNSFSLIMHEDFLVMMISISICWKTVFLQNSIFLMIPRERLCLKSIDWELLR